MEAIYFILTVLGLFLGTLYVKQRINDIEVLKSKKLSDGTFKEFIIHPKKYISDYTILYFIIVCLILIFLK